MNAKMPEHFMFILLEDMEIGESSYVSLNALVVRDTDRSCFLYHKQVVIKEMTDESPLRVTKDSKGFVAHIYELPVECRTWPPRTARTVREDRRYLSDIVSFGEVIDSEETGLEEKSPEELQVLLDKALDERDNTQISLIRAELERRES